MYGRQASPPRRDYSPSRAVDGARDDAHRPPPRGGDRDPHDFGSGGGGGGGRPWSRDSGMQQHERERSPPRRYEERARAPRYDEERDRVPPPRRYDDEYRVPPSRREFDRDYYREYEREYDRAPPRRFSDEDQGRGYRDRDRDSYRDERRHNSRDYDREYERDGRDWRDGRADRTQPSSPSSREVIFLGLDPELRDTDLAGFLRTEFHATLESAKIPRRENGQPKGFGFATFATLAEAERFVYDNYPIVTMPALYPHSSARRVKIDFAGSRGSHQGSATMPEHVPVARGHDGTRDIGQPDGTQRVLLLRGLDPGTYAGEVSRRVAEEIARMLGKGVREAEGTITRVVTVVDRGTEALWSFAFVELVTPELAAALLPFLLSPQAQPNGFLIAQVPIAASFASASAFVPSPVTGPEGGQYLLRAAADGGIGAATIAEPDGEWVAYWNQAAGAVTTAPRSAPSIPPRGSPLLLSDETKAFLGQLAGAQALPPPPTASTQPPTGFAPLGLAAGASGASAPLATNTMQPIKIGINLGGAGAKKKAPVKMEDDIIPISHKNVLGGDDDEGDPGKDSVLLSRTKGAKIIPPTSTSKKIAKNISKWNNKQTELAAPPPPKEPKAPRGSASSVNAIPVGSGTAPAAPDALTPTAATTTGAAPANDAASAEFDYTDTSNFATTGKAACLLCQRQFKSEEVLRKHVAISDLHKARIMTVVILDHRAKRKQRKEATTGPKYRDRAAERRGVFNQPEKPKLPDPYRKYKQGAQGGSSGSSSAPAPPLPPPQQPAAPPPPAAPPAADTANVGNKLLAKMGWTAGTGLGAGAEGRVDPIQVQQFDERVGLGAAKGREAGKWSGPGGWQERKKDLTKERYEAADRDRAGN